MREQNSATPSSNAASTVMPRCWRWKRPEIADWPGQVVTGTFCHRAARTIDLTIAGESSPIGCTANHPFWSEDRQDFVRADSLQPGETLRTTNGLTTVVSTTTVPGQTFVYNLEVHVAHVYHVGTTGVLVHNSCQKTVGLGIGGATDELKALHGAIDWGGWRDAGLTGFGARGRQKTSWWHFGKPQQGQIESCSR
ncbi:MAG: polymorphic toxin-type HINT domain-containing protein [Planctomycetaceae bacterium]